MNEIIKNITKASGDIWSMFKDYCMSHDYKDENFIDGLISISDQLDEKYLNTPMDLLEAHLWAGFVDALCKSMKEIQ